MSMLFIDSSLFEHERDLVLKPESKAALLKGFEESMSVVEKMNCLNQDFKRFELQQEINM